MSLLRGRYAAARPGQPDVWRQRPAHRARRPHLRGTGDRQPDQRARCRDWSPGDHQPDGLTFAGGRIPIDTNLVENAIRPFVIGRKNWLFPDTVRGARSSANLYSLIQTAKANALEPFAYLRFKGVSEADRRRIVREDVVERLDHEQ